VTALSIALALGFALAYRAWTDWLRFKQPVPPHEELKAEVARLAREVERIDSAVGTWGKR
jgi:acyl dehydratase